MMSCVSQRLTSSCTVGASNLAAESADVVLMNDDLNNVANLVQVGRRCVY